MEYTALYLVHTDAFLATAKNIKAKIMFLKALYRRSIFGIRMSDIERYAITKLFYKKKKTLFLEY